MDNVFLSEVIFSIVIDFLLVICLVAKFMFKKKIANLDYKIAEKAKVIEQSFLEDEEEKEGKITLEEENCLEEEYELNEEVANNNLEKESKVRIPKKKYSCRKNEVVLKGNVAYLTTRNSTPFTVIVDRKDIEKLDQYSWYVRSYRGKNLYVCHRYLDTDGSWKTISLGRHLGYGKGWKHKNGNLFDFRKENMVNLGRKDIYKSSPFYKEEDKSAI